MKKSAILDFTFTFLGTVGAGLTILLIYDYLRDRKAVKSMAGPTTT